MSCSTAAGGLSTAEDTTNWTSGYIFFGSTFTGLSFGGTNTFVNAAGAAFDDQNTANYNIVQQAGSGVVDNAGLFDKTTALGREHSLRPHPVGHPSSSTRDSASRTVPSSIRVRRDGYREAGEWQQAEGDQRDRAAQKVFARAGSRNRAVISGSARPPIITVIGASLLVPD